MAEPRELSAAEIAVRTHPELRRLADLRQARWMFLVPRHHADGRPEWLDGFRAWPDGWIDAIRIFGPCDAGGLRSDGREPPGIVWERSGSLVEVIDGLLTLPAPDDRLAPRLVTGHAPQLWTPWQ